MINKIIKMEIRIFLHSNRSFIVECGLIALYLYSKLIGTGVWCVMS